MHNDTLSHTYAHYVFASAQLLTCFLLFAQNDDTALLLAALGDNLDLVKILLAEFGSSLNEVNNVSVYFIKCCAACPVATFVHNISDCHALGVLFVQCVSIGCVQ